MNFFNLLGGIFDSVVQKPPFTDAQWKWLGSIVKFMGDAIIPITIVILAVGVAWCIWLGIQLARAESADKAGEVKKRLINVAIAFVVTLIAIWIITMLMAYLPSLAAVDNPVETPGTSTSMFYPSL